MVLVLVLAMDGLFSAIVMSLTIMATGYAKGFSSCHVMYVLLKVFWVGRMC